MFFNVCLIFYNSLGYRERIIKCCVLRCRDYRECVLYSLLYPKVVFVYIQKKNSVPIYTKSLTFGSTQFRFIFSPTLKYSLDFQWVVS